MRLRGRERGKEGIEREREEERKEQRKKERKSRHDVCMCTHQQLLRILLAKFLGQTTVGQSGDRERLEYA